MAVVGVAPAATPPSGSISGSGSVSWTGGPFTISNPATCVGPTDPTCDHFQLTVTGATAPVKVTIDGAAASDDYDVYIYNHETLAGFAATASGDETAYFLHNGGTRTYEIRVQPFLVGTTSTYSGDAQLGGNISDVEPPDCLELVPEGTASVSGVTDTGQTVTLNVRVLLDGPSLARATQVFADAADSYAPLGITLSATYQTVSFTGTDAQGLLDQAKSALGGIRPATADGVYVFTTKDIEADGDAGVAGLADCIGGVQYADKAFAVGEDYNVTSDGAEDLELGPITFYVKATAKIAAHEIGHLMSAHHHYASCVEGLLTEIEELEPSPCTLMGPLIDVDSQNFSVLNGAIVRGNALAYA